MDKTPIYPHGFFSSLGSFFLIFNINPIDPIRSPFDPVEPEPRRSRGTALQLEVRQLDWDDGLEEVRMEICGGFEEFMVFFCRGFEI